MDRWLVVGCITISLVLGYMVGASSSPVASVIIPSIFGMLLITIGIITSTNKKLFDFNLVSKQLGITLVLFSFFYIIGTILGANARHSNIMILSTQKTKVLPWNNLSEPKDIRVALDWIGVQEKLLELGYSNKQIQYLYSIEGAKDLHMNGLMGGTQWLSEILSGNNITPNEDNVLKNPPLIVDNPRSFNGGRS